MNSSPASLLNGSHAKNILKLAWPILIALLLQVSFNVVDMIFIGRLGVDELAAVSLSFPMDYFMITVALGLGIGVTSLVARKIGARDKAGADNTAEHAVLTSFIIAGLFTLIGIIFGPTLYSFFSPGREIALLMKEYMSVLFLGSVFLFFGMLAMSILQGAGDTKTPMKALSLAMVINIILDPIFIFGLFGLPRLGVQGAAFATVTARAIGCLFLIRHLFLKNRSFISFRFKHFKWQISIIKDIFYTGIPAAFSQLSGSLGLMGLNKLAAFLGPVAVAAYGIGYKFDSLALLPVFGICSASITLVGLHVGAQNIEQARKVVIQAIKMAIKFIVPIAFIFFLGAKYLMFIFTTNPDVVGAGIKYIRIMAFAYPFMSIAFLIVAGFIGTGKAGISLLINLIRVIGFNLLLGSIFAFGFKFGMSGLWLGIALSALISAVLAWQWWRKARLL